MSTYRPATAKSDAIPRPPCGKCGSKFMLAAIESDKPGYEKHTFECRRCGHSKSIAAEIK